MTKFFQIALFIFGMAHTLNAQKCDCIKNTTKVIGLMKEKYAGFKYKANSKLYMKFEQQVRKKSALKKIDCSILIYSYLNYFSDKHISFDDVISMPEYNNLKSDSKQHAASSYSPLEGIWATSNNLYIIDIRRKGNSYSGYLINSKLAEYSPGDLKIQLFGDDGENPYGIIYEKGELNVSRIFQFVKIKGQLLQIGPLLLKKISRDDIEEYKKLPQIKRNSSITIKQVSNTIVLSIPSFRYTQIKVLDSILRSNDSMILSKSTLILDIRDNFGGVLETSYPLFKYISTQPVSVPGACYLSILEGVNLLNQSLLDTSITFTDAERVSYMKLIRRFRESMGQIICDTPEVKNFSTVMNPPENIAIITNHNTGSAAEIFLLMAKQSKKVKVFGTNSCGMVDFGWPIDYKLPCKTYNLSIPMQTNTNYPSYAYDLNGIQPDITISANEADWLSYVIKHYEKK